MASISDLASAAIASSSNAAPAQLDGSGAGNGVTAEEVTATTGGSGVVRGALVILEGMDRSGKTTQVKLLEQRFVELGKKVKVMRFPGTSSDSLLVTGGGGS